MTKAKAVKPKPIKPKTKLSQKTVAWIIGGVVVIIVFIAIAIGMASNKSSNDSPTNNRDSLSIENGKGEEIKTKYYHLDNNKFFIKIPTDFHALTSAEINKKYSGEVPDTVFSNSDNNVNIAISAGDTAVANNQIKEYLDVMKELLESSSDIIDSNYYEVDGHNVATIKVATSGKDGDFYNHMMFFSYEDKLVVISFNCELGERETWEKVGDFIIQSLYFE